MQRYAANSPTNFVDPTGLDITEFRDEKGAGAIHIYSDRSILSPLTATEYIGTITYRSDAERALALKSALDKDTIAKFGQLRDGITKTIAVAEIATSVVAEGADTAKDVVEFANKPSVCGAAAIALPSLAGKAVKKFSKNLPRFDGPKPKYFVNPEHASGTIRRGKTPLANDAEEVFHRAVPDDPVNPRHWYGKNSDGQIYRFSNGNDGTAHFSGIDNVGDGIRSITRYAKDRLGE
ncbi:MAG: hypothetical protein NT013_29500 [Planctomycetia bacterium]|nr:hypothetical protein [Planctomycetia bacterium]